MVNKCQEIPKHIQVKMFAIRCVDMRQCLFPAACNCSTWSFTSAISYETTTVRPYISNVGNLVTQRFAAPRGHDRQRIPPGEHVVQ